jgi:hypothetical protein
MPETGGPTAPEPEDELRPPADTSWLSFDEVRAKPPERRDGEKPS